MELNEVELSNVNTELLDLYQSTKTLKIKKPIIKKKKNPLYVTNMQVLVIQ